MRYVQETKKIFFSLSSNVKRQSKLNDECLDYREFLYKRHIIIRWFPWITWSQNQQSPIDGIDAEHLLIFGKFDMIIKQHSINFIYSICLLMQTGPHFDLCVFDNYSIKYTKDMLSGYFQKMKTKIFQKISGKQKLRISAMREKNRYFSRRNKRTIFR